MMNIQERYDSDPVFRSLVNAMQYYIEKAALTPTEIREAAMLAQIRYESRHPRPMQFTAWQVLSGEV